MVSASDLDDHLVQMPTRTGPQATSTKAACGQAAELEEPAPNRFVRSIDAALRKHFINVAEGEGEAGIEPDSVHNH